MDHSFIISRISPTRCAEDMGFPIFWWTQIRFSHIRLLCNDSVCLRKILVNFLTKLFIFQDLAQSVNGGRFSVQFKITTKFSPNGCSNHSKQSRRIVKTKNFLKFFHNYFFMSDIILQVMLTIMFLFLYIMYIVNFK